MDVQLYIFINGAWQEYNPKPAAHSHTISEVEGLSVALNAKAPAAQVVRATTESKNILGTSEEVFNISEKKVWFNKGALFYGTAAAAGLVTRGISGASQTGSAKDHLYINYDGNNTLSRQLVLGAGSIGTNRGHGIYDYSAVRGDAFIAYLTNTLGSYAKESDISAWAKKTSLAIGDIPTGTTGSTVALGNHTHSAATTSAAGFMSSADKTKLNSIATGAQKNSTITKAEIETSLGYTPEDAANKITRIRTNADDTSYVSELGVKTYVDGLIGSVYRPAGNWNANTNSPTLVNNTPANAGKVYRVSVAGTRFGFTFAVGDKLAFNESGVISKWDNVDDVVSVNGQIGTVVLTTDNINQGTRLYVSQGEKNKLSGIQTGAQVNKIESISLDSVELPISNNKDVSIPTIPIHDWALGEYKPSYAYSEITNKPTIPSIPSVMTTTEGNTGTATTQRTINAKNLKDIILNHSPAGSRPASDISAWAKKTSLAIGDIPTGTTGTTVALGNHTHSQYLTSFTESDPTVPSWAKTAAPSAVRFMRMNANNTITWQTAANFRSDIGAGTSNFSGSYNDLSNKPSIPAAQVQSDWNATSGMGVIKNKPNLAPSNAQVNVQSDWNATSGDAFIKNKPTTLSGYGITLTGDVTASANSNVTTIANNAITTAKIYNNAVTLAKIQNIGSQTVLGNATSNTDAVTTIPLINIDELDLVETSDLSNYATTTELTSGLAGKSSWTEVWSGSSTNLNSYTDGWYQATVPFNSYVGKRIAIEVQYIGHTSKIIFGVLGSSRTTAASASISRGIGWSYFDGTNLRVKTLYAYTPTGTSTAIYVGYLKSLLGSFSGTTIEWSTSHSETLYMRKIWVIE